MNPSTSLTPVQMAEHVLKDAPGYIVVKRESLIRVAEHVLKDAPGYVVVKRESLARNEVPARTEAFWEHDNNLVKRGHLGLCRWCGAAHEGTLCPDCGLLRAAERHRTLCPDSCNGCSKCLSVCWRDYHFDKCQNRGVRGSL